MCPTNTKWQIQFLPCGVSFLVQWKKEERVAQKANLLCLYCSCLFPFGFWVFLVSSARNGQIWGRIQETMNHREMFISLLTYVLYKHFKRWFSLHMDKMLNMNSYLFTNTNSKFWNTEFATFLVTFHLQAA